jgi:hypothetical protein
MAVFPGVNLAGQNVTGILDDPLGEQKTIDQFPDENGSAHDKDLSPPINGDFERGLHQEVRGFRRKGPVFEGEGPNGLICVIFSHLFS